MNWSYTTLPLNGTIYDMEYFHRFILSNQCLYFDRFIRSPIRKIFEALVVAALTAGCGFWMIYLLHDCKPTPTNADDLYPIQVRYLYIK